MQQIVAGVVVSLKISFDDTSAPKTGGVFQYGAVDPWGEGTERTALIEAKFSLAAPTWLIRVQVQGIVNLRKERRHTYPVRRQH